MSTSTGPGRPVEAMWKAAWMYSGMWRGSVTSIECLTTGIVIPVTSASWKPSVPIRSVRTWPVMNTVGTESIIASVIAVTRLVAPGPGGRERDPDPAGGLRVALGGVAGALLVARLDVGHVGVVERVVGGQVGAAGDAEDVLDPLGLECFDRVRRPRAWASDGSSGFEPLRAVSPARKRVSLSRSDGTSPTSSPGFQRVRGRIARSITRSRWRSMIPSIEVTSSSPRWWGSRPRSWSLVLVAL